MTILLSTAYWPNLETLYHILRADKVVLETQEHFVKQSFRNRCEILSANGVLRLSVPVKKNLPDTPVKEIEISYRGKWQKEHWRALCSAYNNSPFFEYFKEDIQEFYETEEQFLFDYNLQLLNFIFKMLRINKVLSFSEKYEPSPVDVLDMRKLADSKSGPFKAEILPDSIKKTYYQTFGDKFDFVPNLSFLDLLFNAGNRTKEYLLQDWVR